MMSQGPSPSIDPPWEDCPRNWDEVISSLLQYAILAPSNFNSQPWKFAISENQLFLYADPSRWLKKIDPEKREMHFSLGCCIENFLIAARYCGFSAAVAYFPSQENPDWICTMTLRKEERRKEKRLSLLLERYTPQGSFQPLPAPPFLSDRLCQFAQGGVRVIICQSRKEKEQVDVLSREANRLRFEDREFRREFDEWKRREGVSRIEEKKDFSEVLSGASLFGVLVSRANSRRVWLQVGRILERIYLWTTSSPFKMRPLSRLIEVPSVQNRLKKLFQISWHIQQPFLIGIPTAIEKKPSPRRPLSELVR